LQLPLERTEYAQNIYWVYGLMLDDSVGMDAKKIMKLLGESGVGTRPFFYPMHQQPVLQRMGFFKGESYPVAERMYEKGFYIPSGMALDRESIFRVVDILRSILVK
jgi:perosamine synthetase